MPLADTSTRALMRRTAMADMGETVVPTPDAAVAAEAVAAAATEVTRQETRQSAGELPSAGALSAQVTRAARFTAWLSGVDTLPLLASPIPFFAYSR